MNASIAHGQGINTSKLAATFGMKMELSKGLVEAQQFRYTARDAPGTLVSRDWYDLDRMGCMQI